MNDPHVVSLRYFVKTSSNISYNNPPAVTVREADYELALADGVLIVTMIGHHATVGSAMKQVSYHLRAWELQTALELGPGSLSFEYDSAELIDRNPPPPGSPLVYTGSASLTSRASVKGVATVSVARANYPKPPTRFAASPMVEHLWNRYQMYLEKRDILTTMGYFCLSSIQNEAGNRGKAVTHYKIDKDVLDKLGTLTSNVGDESSARKIDDQSTRKAHTEPEKAWVEDAVKKIIRRVAELDFDASTPVAQITMADLPPL